jgi:hypothetical protein
LCLAKLKTTHFALVTVFLVFTLLVNWERTQVSP